MAVKQYPHYLFVYSSGEARQNEDGTWENTTSVLKFHSFCREETNGGGQEVQVAGGIFRRYSSLIQLPKCGDNVGEGTSVIVANNSDGSDIRIKGQVLKFDKGQLHSRIWL